MFPFSWILIVQTLGILVALKGGFFVFCLYFSTFFIKMMINLNKLLCHSQNGESSPSLVGNAKR